MSHEQILATLSRLEAAERAACGHESIDVNSVAGQCPAYQPYVFVRPLNRVLRLRATPWPHDCYAKGLCMCGKAVKG